MTPHIAPIALAHWPAQLITISASMSPSSVRTAVTDRPAPQLSATAMPVTRVRSLIVAPRIRAPLASAAVRSVGLARPSPGSQIAPTRSETFMIGYSSAARCGLISSHSSPNASAVAAVRRSAIIRSAVRATVTPPHRRKPVVSPVSASSRS